MKHSRHIPARLLILLSVLMAGIGTQTRTALAASIIVNSTADVVANDGACTLREAITNANNDNQSGSTDCAAGSGADTITLPAGIYTLALAGNNEELNASGDLDIRSNLAIVGAGAKTTVIQAGTNASNGVDRLFDILFASNTVSISDVTIRYGRATGSWPSSAGGAIFNRGTLTLAKTYIYSNDADNSGGAIYVYGSGTLTVLDSTIANNVATADSGAIQADSAESSAVTINIVNSTLSGNSSGFSGAMLLANNSGLPAVINTRFAARVSG